MIAPIRLIIVLAGRSDRWWCFPSAASSIIPTPGGVCLSGPSVILNTWMMARRAPPARAPLRNCQTISVRGRQMRGRK